MLSVFVARCFLGMKRRLFFVGLLLVAGYLLFPSAKLKVPGMPGMPAEKTVYYKWKDEKGVWNLSDQPPQGVEAQQGLVDPNTNIIQSPPAVVPAEPKAAAQTEVTLPGLHYVERAGRVLEDAREARDALNGRQQQLDALSAEH